MLTTTPKVHFSEEHPITELKFLLCAYGAFFLSLFKSVVFQFESMTFKFRFCNAFPQNPALALR